MDHSKSDGFFRSSLPNLYLLYILYTFRRNGKRALHIIFVSASIDFISYFLFWCTLCLRASHILCNSLNVWPHCSMSAVNVYKCFLFSVPFRPTPSNCQWPFVWNSNKQKQERKKCTPPKCFQYSTFRSSLIRPSVHSI